MRTHSNIKDSLLDSFFHDIICELSQTRIFEWVFTDGARDCTRHMAIIKVDITAIKSDVTHVGNVISGINTKVNDHFLTMMNDVYAEMMI